MLKSAFNAAREYVEDIKFGLVLPTDDHHRYAMDLSILCAFGSAGFYGAVTANAGLFLAGAVFSIAAANQFADRSQDVRRAIREQNATTAPMPGAP